MSRYQQRYEKIVDQHSKLVYSLARYYLGENAEAEDITQETFIKLWKHIKEVEIDFAEAWLRTCVRHRAIDAIRKHQVVVPLSETVIEDRKSEPMESLIASLDISQSLAKAISKLTEPYKSLIVLGDIQNIPGMQMAKQLNLSDSQVKVYRLRARKKLRELLTGVDL